MKQVPLPWTNFLVFIYSFQLFPLPYPAGFRRQERETPLPGEQLPIDDAGEALHLHDADETRRRLESNPIQSLRLHEAGLRHQLHRDAPSPGWSTRWSNG